MPDNKIVRYNIGLMKRNNEMPDDFIATNSNLSPIFPNVIIEEIKIAIGIASRIMEALAYHRNSHIVKKSRPFPTKSSIYFHNICIINTKNAIKKVAINGPIKDRRISLSNFLIIIKRAVIGKCPISKNS